MIELALVGTPSSGKSTFFKASTLKDVKIASYPFTTLEPNEGLAYVTTNCPCIELNKNCQQCIDGTRFVPIKLWDIAGLVPDAHLGHGRGIAFLDDIRQAQCLIQIIDASGKTDLEGNPCENQNLEKAVEMLEKEITYWMLDIFKRDKRKSQHFGSKEFIQSIETRFSGLGITLDNIQEAINQSKLDTENFKNWSDNDEFLLINTLRKISKPSIIVANKSDLESKKNIEKLKQSCPEKTIIPASADIELALREAAKHRIIEYIPGSPSFKLLKTGLDEKRKNAIEYMHSFLQKHKSTGIQKALNTAVFSVMDMIVVYPVEDPNKLTDKKGRVLPDAYLLKKGSTPKDLAYKIHQDIGDKFIAALDAKTQRNISATQPLKNNDIISIKSGR